MAQPIYEADGGGFRNGLGAHGSVGGSYDGGDENKDGNGHSLGFKGEADDDY